MNKWIIAAAVTTALPFASIAQTPGTAFQYAITGGTAGSPVTLSVGGRTANVVTGRPLSASEEHHTLQVLGDGTRIENKSSDKFYRDDLGRTRIESEDGSVSIEDPVQGARTEIRNGNAVTRANFSIVDDNAVRPRTTKTFTFATSGEKTAALSVAGSPLELKAKAELDAVQAKLSAGLAQSLAPAKAEQRNEEDLGYQVVNGISAQGTRTTTTIPAGQIGNDRQINVVSERWYSPELQMLIKSTNKDPRFGETTYEMTNISQGVPDPTLFLIPASSHR